MNSGTVIKGLSGLFGALLLFIGVRWLIDPAGAAAGLDLPLLQGAARSTQIGDLAAFFLMTGGCALFGILGGRPGPLLAAACLVGLAAICRTLAWLLHDAAFATQHIGAEVVMTTVFLLARRDLDTER